MPLTKAKVIGQTKLTDDIFEVKFETLEPFNFQAGQFITIKIADNIAPCFRAYSITTCPEKNGKNIDICLKFIPGGRGSTWLSQLNPGDTVEFLGPSGKFIFKGEKEKILFVATGAGIAPFNSIIEDQLKKGNKKTIHLLFGLRHIKDVFYKDFFENLAKKYKNFTFDLTLTKPEDNSWKGSTGRVTPILEKMEIDTKNTEVYICGLKDMIKDVTEILQKKSLPKEAINFEQYD